MELSLLWVFCIPFCISRSKSLESNFFITLIYFCVCLLVWMLMDRFLWWPLCWGQRTTWPSYVGPGSAGSGSNFYLQTPPPLLLVCLKYIPVINAFSFCLRTCLFFFALKTSVCVVGVWCGYRSSSAALFLIFWDKACNWIWGSHWARLGSG